MRCISCTAFLSMCLLFPHGVAQAPVAQASPAAEIPQGALERGPLSFSSLTGTSYHEFENDDIQGITFRHFTQTATGGVFSLKGSSATASVVGTISSLKIDGEKSIDEAPSKLDFKINKLSLTCDIELTRDLTFVEYGGTVIIPKGTALQITNVASIDVRGTAYRGQAGTLRITASLAPLAQWKAANFEVPYIPDPLVLNLQSRAASPITLDIPLDTLRPTIIDATFDARIGSTYSHKSFDLATDTYKSHIADLSVNSFSTHLLRDHLSLAIQGLTCSGEFVGKLSLAAPMPMVSSGTLKLSSLTATAHLSSESAKLEDVQVRGVKLSTPTIHTASSEDHPPPSTPLPAIAHFQPVRLTSEPLLHPAFSEDSSAHLEPGPTEPSPVSLSPRQMRFLIELDLSSPASQQHDAVAASRKQLTTFSDPNFLVHLPSADLAQLVTTELDSIGIPNTTVDFRKQQILLTVKAPPSFLGPDALKFILTIAPSVEGSTIVMRYAVSIAAVTSLNIPTSILIDKIFDQIRTDASSVQIAVTNPNATVVVPLPTKFLQPIDFNQTPPPDPQTKTQVTITSVPASVTLEIAGADLLIDANGIHILATLGLK
jgi:hypothetical protein